MEPTRLSHVGQTSPDGRAYCTLLPNCSSESIHNLNFTVCVLLILIEYFGLFNIVIFVLFDSCEVQDPSGLSLVPFASTRIMDYRP